MQWHIPRRDSSSTLSRSNWNLKMLAFVDGENRRTRRTRRTRRKSLGVRREPTTNSTHVWHRTGIEPGPHCRKRVLPPLRHPCSPNDNLLRLLHWPYIFFSFKSGDVMYCYGNTLINYCWLSWDNELSRSLNVLTYWNAKEMHEIALEIPTHTGKILFCWINFDEFTSTWLFINLKLIAVVCEANSSSISRSSQTILRVLPCTYKSNKRKDSYSAELSKREQKIRHH